MTLSDDILDEIRELMRTGKCDGITIWKTQTGDIQANVRDTRTKAWNCQTDEDPIVALALALEFNDVRRTPAKAKKKKHDDLI